MTSGGALARLGPLAALPTPWLQHEAGIATAHQGPRSHRVLAPERPTGDLALALEADPDFKPKKLAKGDVPFLGVLFKKSQDYVRAAGNVTRRRVF